MMRTPFGAMLPAAVCVVLACAAADAAAEYRYRKPLSGPAPVAAAPGPAASCQAVKQADPAAASGLYTIDPDGAGGGAPFQAYCNHTDDGGGWTAFFVGTNGSPNVFARFETGDACAAPGTQCLRRIPAAVTTGSWLAAECGGVMVKFQPSAAVLALFRSGTQAAWQPVSGTTTLRGAPSSLVSHVWTGSAANHSFIISDAAAAAGTTAAGTFLASYNFNAGWDFCNGAYNTVSPIRVYYR